MLLFPVKTRSVPIERVGLPAGRRADWGSVNERRRVSRADLAQSGTLELTSHCWYRPGHVSRVITALGKTNRMAPLPAGGKQCSGTRCRRALLDKVSPRPQGDDWANRGSERHIRRLRDAPSSSGEKIHWKRSRKTFTVMRLPGTKAIKMHWHPGLTRGNAPGNLLIQ